MNISDGIAWLTAPITQGSFFGITWLLQIAIIIITLVIITRHVEDWGTLLLPVILGWRTAGLDVNYVLFMISIFTFVIGALSTKTIGEAMTTLSALGKRKEQAMAQFDSAKQSVGRWKRQGFWEARREEKLRKFIEKQGSLIAEEQKKYGKLGYIGTMQKLRGEKPTADIYSQRIKDMNQFRAQQQASVGRVKRTAKMLTQRAMRTPTREELNSQIPDEMKPDWGRVQNYIWNQAKKVKRPVYEGDWKEIKTEIPVKVIPRRKMRNRISGIQEYINKIAENTKRRELRGYTSSREKTRKFQNYMNRQAKKPRKYYFKLRREDEL